MHFPVVSALSLLIGSILVASLARGQQVGVGVSNQALSDGYFERMGVQWGLRFRQGSFNLALPPFGGYAPGAGITGGFGPFGFEFSQGSRRTFTSQSLGVLVPNGVPGFVADSSWTPFVMGTVPVVGGFPVFTAVVPPTPAAGSIAGGNPAVQQALEQARMNPQTAAAPGGLGPGARAARNVVADPAAGGARQKQAEPSTDSAARLAAAQTSSAGRAAPSVAAAKQALQAERAEQIATARAYLLRGQEAEGAGKIGVARIYYQMAARHADGELKADAMARLNALQPAATGSR